MTTICMDARAARAQGPASPPSLRVLLLNSYLPPQGGAEVHVQQVHDLLRGAGHNVELLVPEPAGRVRNVLDRACNLGFRRRLRDAIATFRPDVIHVHNFLRRMGVAPFLCAAEHRVPLMLTVHDFQLYCPRTWAVRADGSPCQQPWLPRCALGNCRGSLAGLSGRAVYAANALRRAWVARIVRRTADRIVAPSQALADRLAQVVRADVAVLPHPAPAPGPFVSSPSSDLLFLGRTAREKGLRELLVAMAEGSHDLRLTVAGDGPERADLAQLVRTLRLDGRVTFTGWVDAARAGDMVRAHGALVVPSVWAENSPLVVQEALANGRPVLGSRRGGIPELIEDGKTGFLFEPLDPRSLGGALRRWQDAAPEQRAAMGRNAHARAAATGGEQGFLARLLAAYEDTMRAARARR